MGALKARLSSLEADARTVSGDTETTAGTSGQGGDKTCSAAASSREVDDDGVGDSDFARSNSGETCQECDVGSPMLCLDQLLVRDDVRPQDNARRTKLKSSVPSFAPASQCGAQCGGSRVGDKIAEKDGLYGELSGVLKLAARSLTFHPDVEGIRVVENEASASCSIYIEVASHGLGLDGKFSRRSNEVVRALAKSAILQAAEQSNATYVLGYLTDPFTDVGCHSFKVTLALMRSSRRSC